ncbi:hypothetical protein PT276_10600 [Orbaceae bacterium ESL0721]|nr:hypothetical protein [Orbaceae bacterium ESL0721]
MPICISLKDDVLYDDKLGITLIGRNDYITEKLKTARASLMSSLTVTNLAIRALDDLFTIYRLFYWITNRKILMNRAEKGVDLYDIRPYPWWADLPSKLGC